MCYPMNEFETDFEKNYKPAGGWMSSPSCPVETSMKRGRDVCSAVASRDSNEKKTDKVALNERSYPLILAGISAGALLALVIAGRLRGKFC